LSCDKNRKHESDTTYNHDLYSVSLPKSVNKTLRYIKQDASMEKVREIESLLQKAVNKRVNEMKRGQSL